jgi:hypothetical protein
MARGEVGRLIWGPVALALAGLTVIVASAE